MKDILQKITNTIVANLDNTSNLGLRKGKLGLCCYLYKYSEVLNSPKHEELASEIIQKVFDELAMHINILSLDMLSELGVGLAMLLEQGLIEDSKDNDMLRRMDRIIMKKAMNLEDMNKASLNSDIFLPGIYILYRLKRYSNNLDYTLLDTYLKDMISQFTSSEDIFVNSSTVRYWISVLFVFTKVAESIGMYAEEMNPIASMVFEALKHNCKYLNVSADSSKFLNYLGCFLNDNDRNVRTDEHNPLFDYENSVWNYVIYDWDEPKDAFLKSDYERYVDDAITNSFYSLMTVNSQLAGIGIWLLSKRQV